MKRSLLALMCLLLAWSAQAQSLPQKTLVAVRGGYVVALNADEGWGAWLRHLTYFGKSDLYTGWVASVSNAGTAGTSGSVGTAEAGPLLGYAPLAVKGPNMDVSVALEVLSVRSTGLPALELQAPALLVQLGLVLPVSQGLEVELSFAPVLRPYTLATGRWDYAGTAFSMGLELRAGQYVTTQNHYWTDAHNDR